MVSSTLTFDVSPRDGIFRVFINFQNKVNHGANQGVVVSYFDLLDLQNLKNTKFSKDTKFPSWVAHLAHYSHMYIVWYPISLFWFIVYVKLTICIMKEGGES